MTTRKLLFAAAAVFAALAMQSSAQALTLTECSAKYKDAKAAGTLNGASWNDFRKIQCDAGTGGRAAKGSAASAGAMVIAENVVFPTVVDSLPRSVQGQQSDQCQWRLEMAATRRRLLQPMRQEAEGSGVAGDLIQRSFFPSPPLRGGREVQLNAP